MPRVFRHERGLWQFRLRGLWITWTGKEWNGHGLTVWLGNRRLIRWRR